MSKIADSKILIFTLIHLMMMGKFIFAVSFVPGMMVATTVI